MSLRDRLFRLTSWTWGGRVITATWSRILADMPCSIAGTLEVAGEPWPPLIIRDVWVGLTRFDEIQRDLGISRKVLAERLKWLIAHGVIEQRLYSVLRGTYPCRPFSVGP